jgi:hypothetical protein
LSFVIEKKSNEISPANLAAELGISLQTACSELCGLLQVVGPSASFRVNEETQAMTFTFPSEINVSPCPVSFTAVLSPELRQRLALPSPSGTSEAAEQEKGNSSDGASSSSSAAATQVRTEASPIVEIGAAAAAAVPNSLTETTSTAANPVDRKRKHQSPEIAAAYKALVNAGVEKEEAAEELEQAEKRLKEARDRDEAADAQVSVAVQALEKEGYDWNHYDTAWVQSYGDLLKFKKQHGHCSVPIKASGSLGKWVTRQRQAYRVSQQGDGPSSMTQSRQDLLNAIGFDWGTPQGKKVSWEERYRELLAFKETFGHCNVSQNTEYHTLALWVSSQRKGYQRIQDGLSPGGLTEERVRLLEEAGFVWRRHKYKNRTKKVKESV